jgi:fructose PTS system EIIA component
MTDIFSMNYIKVNEDLSTQSEAFARIAEIAAAEGLASSKEEVAEGLAKREGEGTTGFMDGFAIPHTKSPAVVKPGAVILKANEGIEWQSMDGKPIKFIISLLIPDNEAGTTHLTLLSHISRLLIHADVREKLLAASTPEEILEEFREALVNS